MRILLVEDTQTLARAICEHFASDGHVVDWNVSVKAARGYLATVDETLDLVVLDVMLPDGSGAEVLTALRQHPNAEVASVPVLVLTARSQVADRVQFLDRGADDYITKPFHFDELDARCRAIVRRRGGQSTNVISLANLSLDLSTGGVTVAEEPVNLRSRELRMLEVFLKAPNQIFSKARLIEKMFTIDETPSENAIEVYVGRLRRKLAKGNMKIETVRGIGYRMVAGE